MRIKGLWLGLVCLLLWTVGAGSSLAYTEEQPIATAAGELNGTVVDGDGFPLMWMTVSLSDGVNAYSVQTEEDGTYRMTDIPTGSYTAWLGADGESLYQYVYQYEIRAGEVQTLNFLRGRNATETTGALTGQVLDPYGFPVPYASVSIASNQKSWKDMTDQDGTFRIGGIEPGTYQVDMYTGNGGGMNRYNVGVAAGQTVTLELDFAMTVHETSGAISGTALDADGLPVADASVWFRSDAGLWSMHTAEDGSFGVGSLPEGKYRMSFSVPNGQQQYHDVFVTAGVQTAQDILYASAPTVTHGAVAGLVTNLLGAPLAGADVRVAIGGSVYTVKSAEDGTYSIGGLPIGTHPVTASLQGYAMTALNGQLIIAGETTTVNFILLN